MRTQHLRQPVLLLYAAALAALMVSSIAYANPEAEMKIGYLTVARQPGDHFYVSVEITAESILSSYEATIRFDPAVVDLVLVEPETIRIRDQADTFDQEPPQNLRVATLEFVVIGAEGDFTPLDLESAVLRDWNGLPLATVTQGVPLIVGPAPVRLPVSTVNPPWTPLPSTTSAFPPP